ncbi:putative PYRUVATE FORMATE LYASE ACTIVATING PROTEIN PFLA domain protein [Mycobacterium kansasii]|uniref:Putative PYRUVATE FORMATE LYASE ACTIVATING PROTEIN PFLA domain protein n=1 Tax=Mycobacterium kansasii TaxID=1768 RepID=A0A1V3XUX2_MYCKA|nr:putative PYRUVATE FORMATE LYASE ACTIVATING PROTEIN PFLA domain protein [Mycobacterium kansasii]
MSSSADDPFTVPTTHWHRLDDGRLQCDVCPRACKLHEDQRGLCFVRGRRADQIVLTSYGRSSGFCVDPIEKKPLNHFLPGSAVLSFGTAGCNLACKFCQNWDISKSRETDTLASRAGPGDIARAADELGCRSVAFTYNDPTIFWEYAADVADACHRRASKRSQ